MKIENQVVSLGLARKLKELGLKQESLLYWDQSADGEGELQIIVPLTYNSHNAKLEMFISDGAVAAFTVAELGEMLPYSIIRDGHEYVLCLPCPDGMKATSKSGGYRYNGAIPQDNLYWNSWQDTEADARAKMLIYLIENKLMRV